MASTSGTTASGASTGFSGRSCRDFFAEAPGLEGRFDVIFSYGFVEHFDDPASVLMRAARFCRPGGHIVTIIPNLLGIPGLLQRLANRPVFDLHRPMNPNVVFVGRRGENADATRMAGTLG